MNIETANFLSSHGDLRVDARFKDITTIRIGGKIDYLVSPYDVERLLLILRYLREKDIPFKILGRGSNLLCGEADYEGCVIRLDHINEYSFDKDSVTVGAGATTLAEVIATGVPSVLIPSPYVPNNHQYFNAKALSDKNAAVLIEEKQLTPELLKETIESLLKDEQRRKELSKQTESMRNDHVIDDIIDEIEKL